MVRNAFNGGELSPSMRVRMDMDVFQRGCSCVENFDIGQTGGVSRRRGFVSFAPAQGVESRLFPYKYRNNVRFLVEVGQDKLRVYNVDGQQVFEIDSLYDADALATLRVLQVNALLLFTCSHVAPMQLTCDAESKWEFKTFAFKVHPWRHSEYRDHAVHVSQQADGNFAVQFSDGEDAQEAVQTPGEALRVSYYTDSQEVKGKAADCFERVTEHQDEGFINTSTSINEGTIVAVRRAPEYAVWSCTQAWDASAMFVDGLIDCANYTNNFQLSSDTSAWDIEISALNAKKDIAKGKRVRFIQGYWEIFTCVHAFDGAVDWRDGGVNPEDYPGHFVRGMMLGAKPCKGKWSFYTTGSWFGSYEVRACYDGKDAADAWEFRGETFSRNVSPTNTPMSGDESAEECYISLWLTRVRAFGTEWHVRNFPADACGNTLTVASYKHDMVLKYDEGGYYTEADGVHTEWYGSISSFDWSWCAFAFKYGHPRLACIFNQRLVFASTESQPQTLWLSQVDNIDNFDIIKTDAGAMALTMSSQTQDAIRWMSSQNSRIMLGTAEGEFVVQASNGAVMTYANASIVTHGFVGAADVDAVQASDKIIYFERGGSRAMQHGYDYAQDAYISSDLTIFAEHVLRDGGGVKEGTFLRKPDAKAVLVLHDGRLALMTYNSMHQVHAWHRYITDGKFLSVAMLPNGNEADSLYAVVERETDGVTSWGIERMNANSPFEDAGGRDYVSTLLTNSLMSTRLGSPKQTGGSVAICCLSACPIVGVEFTANGGKTWSSPSKYAHKELPVGWHEDSAFSSNESERVVGFRVHGNRDMQVLAIQG